MNNKNRIANWIIVCQIFFSLHLLAQDIVLSEAIYIPQESSYQLIGKVDSLILIYKKTNNTVTIEGFDQQLQKLWSKKIDFPKNTFVKILKTITSKNSFQLLYTYQQKGINYIQLKRIASDAKEITDQTILQYKSIFTNPYCLVSKNKKQLLISYFANNKTYLYNFDLKSNKSRWHKEIDKIKNKESLDWEQLVINNQGDVFYYKYLGKIKASYPLVCYRISPNLATDTLWFAYENYSLESEYDEINQQLTLVGLYEQNKSMGNTDKGAKGIFHAKWASYQKKISPIVFNTLPVFLDPNSNKNKVHLIENYVPMPLVLRKNGGLLFIAEQRYIYQSMGAFGDQSPEGDNDYIYKNILISSISPNGKIEWSELLHKEQTSSNDNARYSSFFVFKNRAAIRLLFNDNIRWDSGILEYIIDTKDDVSRNVIPHHKKKYDVTLELSHSLQISKNSFITLSEVESFGNRNLYLTKVSY